MSSEKEKWMLGIEKMANSGRTHFTDYFWTLQRLWNLLVAREERLENKWWLFASNPFYFHWPLSCCWLGTQTCVTWWQFQAVGTPTAACGYIPTSWREECCTPSRAGNPGNANGMNSIKYAPFLACILDIMKYFYYPLKNRFLLNCISITFLKLSS